MMKILYSSFLREPEKVGFEGEDKDEKIILVLRQHPITNTPWILFSIFLLLAPIFLPILLRLNQITTFSALPLSYKFIIGTFWYVFSFGYLFTSFLGWYFTVYLVTNKRLVDIDFEGLIHRRFSDALLSNVEDLTHQISGALQVIFNYGTLHIQTAGEHRELDFENIPTPTKVHDIVSDLSAGAHRRLGPNHDD